MMLKVCGMAQKENISELLDVKPDFMGLIFYERSPRFPLDLLPEQIPDSKTRRVGVFVKASIDHVMEMVEKWSLDLVQLHGDEDLSYVKALSDRGIKIIKVFRVKDAMPEDMESFSPYVEYFLFDTKKSEAFGGTGEQFDWRILSNYSASTNYLISGGIGPEDIEKIKLSDLPKCMGIDINSGVEISPGIKDIKLIKEIREKI